MTFKKIKHNITNNIYILKIFPDTFFIIATSFNFFFDHHLISLLNFGLKMKSHVHEL